MHLKKMKRHTPTKTLDGRISSDLFPHFCFLVCPKVKFVQILFPPQSLLY